MNTLPATLVGPARGRITRRLAAVEQVVFGGLAQPGAGTTITRTTRGTFIRSRSSGTASGTAASAQIPRWM